MSRDHRCNGCALVTCELTLAAFRIRISELRKMKPKGTNKRRFFTPKQKSDNRGIHIKGKWKAVDLDPSIFSDEGMGGLVCFEELTDYSLVDSQSLASNLVKKEKKPRKRKPSETEQDDGEFDMEGDVDQDATRTSDETTKTSDKPAKKKIKKAKVADEATKTSDKPAKKEIKKAKVAAPEIISADVDGDDQVLVSKEKVENRASNEECAGGEDLKNDVQSEVETTIEKKKKKKQKATETQPETLPEAKVEVEVKVLPKKQPSKDKANKLPKIQKNWTNAALSGSSNQNVDVSAWKDLFVPAPVLKALSHLGFASPTPIQALALPSAIRDRMDIVGAAETGSGKTLSFAIPMIHTILEWKKSAPEKDDDMQSESPVVPDAEKGDDARSVTEEEPNTEAPPPQDLEDVEGDLTEDENDDGTKMGCVKVIDNVEFDFEDTAEDIPSGLRFQPLLGLVIAPTRELAVQVKHHIDAVAQFTDIKAAIIVGGMSQQKQSRMLKRQPEIVIATPGRLWELIREGHPHLLTLRHLKCLVIDEADRMVERGHFAELESILEMLSTTYFNPKRQMFVFSATLTMAASVPSRLLQKKRRLDTRSKLEILMHKVGIKSKPKVIDLTRKEATVETLIETQIHCDKDDKDFYLYYFLLQYPGRTMVFANSIDCIKRLNCLLVILDRTPLPLHANMHQKQRLKNLERFAERDSCVLLTTDVAARGLDIPNVQHVVHYQVPRTSETYVHRSGRTARATKEGLSLLIISPDDMLNYKKIYRALGKDEEEVSMFPVQNKCMDVIKERVGLAREIEKIEFHNGKEKSHNSWFRKAAEDLEVDLDDDVLMGRGRDEHDDRQQQKMVKGMKKHLKYLLSQPVFKHDIRTKYPTQMGKLSLPVMPRAGVESAITSVSKQPKKPRQKKAKQQQ
ncbi:unnamed protein product [Gadus morhua 'NCC']